VSLTAQKPKDSAYPSELDSLGDHIRKRRLGLGLFQHEVARQLGVDESTVLKWESNESQPAVRQIPGIIKFLEYNPFPAAKSLAENLKQSRQVLGLSQRLMAKQLGVDPTTLGFWERGERIPSKKLRMRIEVSFSHFLSQWPAYSPW
jgi:transcriptional regulator with XRE-family HTH domain